MLALKMSYSAFMWSWWLVRQFLNGVDGGYGGSIFVAVKMSYSNFYASMLQWWQYLESCENELQ